MWRIMRQAGLPGLEDDVKVIAHKAVGQRPGVKARKTLYDHCQEQLAVVVVFEDQVAPGPLPGHMVKPPSNSSQRADIPEGCALI